LTPVAADFNGLWTKYRASDADFWSDADWITLFAGIQYRKDTYGFVHFKGATTMNTIGTVATIPVNYRPASSAMVPLHGRYRYHSISGTTVRFLSGSVQITAAGAVITADSGTGDVQIPGTMMFDGLTYYAEN
jgi:hypothetical protein